MRIGEERCVYIDFCFLLESAQRLSYPWLFLRTRNGDQRFRSEAFHAPETCLRNARRALRYFTFTFWAQSPPL